MTVPVPSLDVAAIRARVEAATGGPRYALTSGVECGDHWSVCAESDHVAVAHIHANDGQDEDRRRPDAVFVAAARTDVPALLAALESADVQVDPVSVERDEARAALGRIEALHPRVVDSDGEAICTECLDDRGGAALWPCPTIAALRGDEG